MYNTNVQLDLIWKREEKWDDILDVQTLMLSLQNKPVPRGVKL